MKIDLDKGAFLEIGGELGRYNSLPIDDLVKIAQDFQELIFSIAKFDLPSTEAIDLKNFQIELIGFEKASAVPQFAYTKRSENRSGHQWQIHRKIVNEKFDKLIEISNSGDYSQLAELMPEPIKRNPIVEKLYSFANDFGNAPVSFVEYDVKKKEFMPIFKIHRFKPGVKKELISEIRESEKMVTESDEAVAKVKITNKNGKISKRIMDTYSKTKYSLEYAPDLVIAGDTKYFLKFPLRCLFEKEDNYFVLHSEMLGIIGTGLTEDEAEIAFGEEFDFIYERFNSLDNDSLTDHNRLIKSMLNQIIEKIEK
jgi:hypothetical protein